LLSYLEARIEKSLVTTKLADNLSGLRNGKSLLFDCLEQKTIGEKIERVLQDVNHEPFFVWRLVTLDLWSSNIQDLEELSL
jgi:hypothetical protein